LVESFYVESLDIYERLSQIHPDAYEPDLASTLNNLGNLYSDTQRFSESEAYHLRALEIRERLSQTNPDAYEPDLASTLNNLGLLYSNTQRFSESETYHLRALEIYERLSQTNPDAYVTYLTRTLTSLSYILLFLNRYSESEEYAQKALSIYPEDLMPYTNLAASLLLQGRFEEAKELYLKYKDELKDSFLSDFEEFKANNIIPQERLDDVEKIIELLK
jgi:tetratricopeptide (TPR) repeat protein